MNRLLKTLSMTALAVLSLPLLAGAHPCPDESISDDKAKIQTLIRAQNAIYEDRDPERALAELGTVDYSTLTCFEEVIVREVELSSLVTSERYLEAAEEAVDQFDRSFFETTSKLNAPEMIAKWFRWGGDYERALEYALLSERTAKESREPLIFDHEVSELKRRLALTIAELYYIQGDYLNAIEWAARLHEEQSSSPSKHVMHFLLVLYLQTGDQPAFSDIQETAEALQFDLATPREVHFNLTPTPGDFREAVLNTEINPFYPMIALERGLEGKCEVRFNIDILGEPYEASPVCTDPIFYDAALDAVLATRWTPKHENGMPVRRTNLVLPLTFSLDQDEPTEAESSE